MVWLQKALGWRLDISPKKKLTIVLKLGDCLGGGNQQRHASGHHLFNVVIFVNAISLFSDSLPLRDYDQQDLSRHT
jgi:hypothetical protein